MRFRMLALGLALPLLVGATTEVDLRVENDRLREKLALVTEGLAQARLDLDVERQNCQTDMATAIADAAADATACYRPGAR